MLLILNSTAKHDRTNSQIKTALRILLGSGTMMKYRIIMR